MRYVCIFFCCVLWIGTASVNGDTVQWATTIKVSLGEGAAPTNPGSHDPNPSAIDGNGTEVISGETWNNVVTGWDGSLGYDNPDFFQLVASDGGATDLRAWISADAQYSTTKGNSANDDVFDTIVSVFGSHSPIGNPAYDHPHFFVDGFAPGQQVGVTLLGGLDAPLAQYDLITLDVVGAETTSINTELNPDQLHDMGGILPLGDFAADDQGRLTLIVTQREAAGLILSTSTVPTPSAVAMLIGLGAMGILRKRARERAKRVA